MSEINLNLSLLKHSDIREEIKKYLKDKYDITYNNGSNFNYIVDFLSILNMYSSYQLTNVAKNLTLASVADRKVAVALSQRLGYSPKKRIPASISGTLRINKSGLSGGVNFTNVYLTGNDTGLPFKIDDFSVDEILDYEVNTNVYEVPFIAKQIEERKITTAYAGVPIYIDSDKIAEETITVTIDPDDYINFENFDTIPSDVEKIFFIEEDTENDGRLFVSFGNGIIGASVASDTTVEIIYYITDGADGNGETSLTLETLNNTASITIDETTITNLNYSYGGRDRETLEEIKANAPRFYVTKNRLVTRKDYEALLKKLEDTDIKFYSVIDMYSQDNLENFYKLGNIYLSFVPSAIYDEETTENTTLTKGETLAFDDISSTLTIDKDSVLSAYEDNFIISTNQVSVSPTYLYIDVFPKIETKNKNYSITNINNDLLPILKDYSYLIEGLGKNFREYQVQDIIMEDSRVNSVDLDIDFSIITNLSNILGTKILNIPNYIVSTNSKSRDIDNLYLGYSYNLEDQPDNRKILYGELKASSEGEFSRYLVLDNYTNNNNTTLSLDLFIDNNNDTFNYQSTNLVLNDGGLAEVVIKTRTTDGDFNYTTSVPTSYVEGGLVDSEIAVTTEDKYFIYFRKNYSYYLLGIVNEDSELNYKISALNISESSYYETYKMLSSHGFFVKNGKAILGNIDYTYNLSNVATENNNCQISVYLLNNTTSEQVDEYLKIKSYKAIGTLGVNSNKKFSITGVEENFKAVYSEDDDYEYISISVTTPETMVLKLQKNKITNLIELEDSVMADYPTGYYENYKNQSFSILNNVLYCHEMVNDVIIGYFDRPNNKIRINDFVYHNDTYNKVETFIDTYGIIDDNSNYRIYLRNNFEITDESIKYIHDFDDVGGICTLVNFHSAIKI